jgi:hypothetical protein
MTSFRRLVMGVAEFLLVVSMLVITFAFGVMGGALGNAYFFDLNSTLVHFGSLGTTSLGAVVGFFLGALIGFTLTCSSAAVVFAIAQIERNTRPIEGEYLPDRKVAW